MARPQLQSKGCWAHLECAWDNSVESSMQTSFVLASSVKISSCSCPRPALYVHPLLLKPARTHVVWSADFPGPFLSLCNGSMPDFTHNLQRNFPGVSQPGDQRNRFGEGGITGEFQAWPSLSVWGGVEVHQMLEDHSMYLGTPPHFQAV